MWVCCCSLNTRPTFTGLPGQVTGLAEQGEGLPDARGGLGIPAQPEVYGTQVVQCMRLGDLVAEGMGRVAGAGVHGDGLREVPAYVEI